MRAEPASYWQELLDRGATDEGGGDDRRPLRRGASFAAGFANRKGIFHERFPALPLPKPTHDLATSGESLCEQRDEVRSSVRDWSMAWR
jgi:hypothetical protein